MSIEGIPSEVQTFLVQEVRSLIALELLLLLWADRGRSWTVVELNRELRASADWTEQELRQLEQRRLVEAAPGPSGHYRFAEAVGGVDHALSWLAGAYPARRFSIIQALYASGPSAAAPPTSPLPPEPLQSFADAFKLRKEPPNG